MHIALRQPGRVRGDTPRRQSCGRPGNFTPSHRRVAGGRGSLRRNNPLTGSPDGPAAYFAVMRFTAAATSA